MKLKVFASVVYLGALLSLAAPALAQSLAGLSYDDRSSIESACYLPHSQGPAAYHECLNQQLALLGDDKAPSLTGLSYDDRASIESACYLPHSEGPAAYHACLKQQLDLLGGDKAPSLAGLSYADRSSIESACYLPHAQGPAAYHACLRRQLGQPGGTPTSNAFVGIAPRQQPSVLVPATPQAPLCAENGSCYGDISNRTGLPKTVSVRGYYRADGTYVRGYYRSK